jgi:glycosyltransferase involved in cell wall biosynthesis
LGPFFFFKNSIFIFIFNPPHLPPPPPPPPYPLNFSFSPPSLSPKTTLDFTQITAEVSYFLSINRFERKKNLNLALQAFAQLRLKSGVKLVMAGGYDKVSFKIHLFSYTHTVCPAGPTVPSPIHYIWTLFRLILLKTSNFSPF